MASTLLLITGCGGPGGTARWLTSALPELGQRHDLHCVFRVPIPVPVPAAPDGTPRVPAFVPLLSVARLFGAFRLWRLLRRVRPAAIMVHGPFSMLGLALLRIVGIGRRIPLMLVLHGLGDEFPHVGRWRSALVRAWIGAALTRRDRIVCVAPHIDRFMQRQPHGAARILTIWNGVAPAVPRSAARRPGPLRVLFLGRLSIEKGADRLPELASALADVAAEIHVAGAGALEPGLRARMAPLIEAGRVFLHGWVPDPGPLLQDADVLAILSRTEGCPFSVLEAFAAATLVASLAVGSMPEVLEHGRAGWLAEDLTALARRLRHAAADPATAGAAEIRAAQALLLQRHSLQGMLARYDALLDEMIGDDGGH